MKIKRFSFLFGILPWFIMAMVVFPRLWFAAENLRMIEVSPLGRDEGFLGGTLWGGWKTGAPIFFSIYGFFYSNIFWFLAKIISLATPITEQLTIVISRGISLLSYLSLGLVSFFWLKKKHGELFAIVFTWLLFLVSKDNDFIIRTTAIQTDLVNFLSILVSFFAILHLSDKFTIKRLFFTSFALGLMMAVKFSTFLLLPFVFLALIKVLRERKILVVKEIKLLNRILKKSIFLVWTVLGTIFIGELMFPTKLTSDFLYFFPLFVVLIIYLKAMLFITKLLANWNKNVAFIWSALTFSVFLATLTFGLFSSKSLFKMDFLNFLFYHLRQQPYFHSLLSDKINIIFQEGLGIFLLSLFMLGTIYSLFNLRRLIIPLVWAWFMIFYFIFLTGGFQIRYIYFIYPPVVYIATVTVIKIFTFISSQRLRYNFLSKSLLILFISSIIFMSFKIIEDQAKGTNYCLECIPGIQAGRWLDRNFPSNQIKIIQEYSVYVPERFSKLSFFDWGDPYILFNSYNPDVIFLRGIHVRKMLDSKDNEIDLIYRGPADKPKKFFSDLYSHKLPYGMASVFGSLKDGNDIIVFVKDSI